MTKRFLVYGVVLIAAIAFEYVAELYWSTAFARGSNTPIPWIVDILAYGLFGALAWLVSRSRSIPMRIAMLVLIAVLPHVLYEITHGSDPAYPYIGLLFILPDLLWVGLGAAVAALIAARTSSQETKP